MNLFVLITLAIGTWSFKSTTDASPVSSKISPESSAAQQSDVAPKKELAELVSSRAHPLMVGPASSTTRYGGSKKIQIINPLKLIKEGKIGYTSKNGCDACLARAFKEDFSDEDFGWTTFHCPQMLWCQFDEMKIPAGLTFRPIQTGQNEFHVTKWQFVATKDSKCNKTATWKVICEDLSGALFKGKWSIKACFAGEEVQEKYKCFGIRVLEGNAASGKYDSTDTFQITNIIMYEKTAGYN